MLAYDACTYIERLSPRGESELKQQGCAAPKRNPALPLSRPPFSGRLISSPSAHAVKLSSLTRRFESHIKNNEQNASNNQKA